MSPNKDETAAHGCNSAVSVLVVLVCHAKSIFFHLFKYDRLGGPCSIVCLFQFHFSAHRSDPLLDPTLAALSSAVPCCF